MDAFVVEFVAQAPEVLRDHRGTILGRIETQQLTGKLVARDARGVVVGSYASRFNETRDAQGRVVGRGNLLGALILRGALMQGLAVLIFVAWLVSTPWVMIEVVGLIVAGIALFAWVWTRQVLEFEADAPTWRRVEPRFEPWNFQEVPTDRSKLLRKIESLEADLMDALGKIAILQPRNERLERDLQVAQTAAASSRSNPLYRRVGLDESAPDWVVTAVRVAYRKRLHPDVHPEGRKAEAERRFKDAEGVFDEISRIRDF